MKKLVFQATGTFVVGLIFLGILLFIPADTLKYWQAWVFILVFEISVSFIGIYLSLKDPALLERRKKVGPGAERNVPQQIIMLIAVVAIVNLLVFCALDHRFGWSGVPAVVSILGDVLVALGLFIDLLVFRENSFGGSTVETFEDQQVISTGLYAVIRHPMYAGVLVMMLGVPLALGSFWGLAIFAILIPGLVWRILDEEATLKKELPGYSEYMQQVRFRLVPYLW